MQICNDLDFCLAMKRDLNWSADEVIFNVFLKGRCKYYVWFEAEKVLG